MRATFLLCLSAGGLALTGDALAQLQERPADNTVRVTVAQNQDGTRTSYEYDNVNRRAVATTTGRDGKVLNKIRYELDENGRYKTGEVFDPKGQLQFRTEYKYDARARLESETQLTKDGAVRNKLVYAYDDMGKQTGFAVYDANGKLLSRSKK